MDYVLSFRTCEAKSKAKRFEHRKKIEAGFGLRAAPFPRVNPRFRDQALLAATDQAVFIFLQRGTGLDKRSPIRRTAVVNKNGLLQFGGPSAGYSG